MAILQFAISPICFCIYSYLVTEVLLLMSITMFKFIYILNAICFQDKNKRNIMKEQAQMNIVKEKNSFSLKQHLHTHLHSNKVTENIMSVH